MRDTSLDAARMQAAVHRRMGGAERLRLAWELSMAVRELARGRIRSTHRGMDEAEVEDTLIWELYGVRRRPR